MLYYCSNGGLFMVINDFKEIMEKYWLEKEKSFKGNVFANKMKNDFKQNLEDLVDEIDDKHEYYVKISPGVGNWSKVPFAGILNTVFPNSFKEGLYVVYSFVDDSGFYLSIGQGRDNTLKKNRIFISKKLGEELKSSNTPIPQGFNIDDEKYN